MPTSSPPNAPTPLGLACGRLGNNHPAEARAAAEEALPVLTRFGDTKGRQLAAELLDRVTEQEQET
ncbi:hypothetical protein [Streptomyces sp. NPDC056492]|uniref:hypothetical protein n=1 Tax=unclassified Streptomyces TaxID=2593676 RepID=UPI0036845511